MKPSHDTPTFYSSFTSPRKSRRTIKTESHAAPQVASTPSTDPYPIIPLGSCSRTMIYSSPSREEKMKHPWLYLFDHSCIASQRTRMGTDLCVKRSSIDHYGLFTTSPIARNRSIIEYVGEIIPSHLADIREQTAERRQQALHSSMNTLATATTSNAIPQIDSYFFRIDEDWVIDATRHGNLSRFINHSCDPNCFARVITPHKHACTDLPTPKQIVFFSRRNIRAGEEILYDYQFPMETDEAKRIQCKCGASNCKGFLN